jgi:hypothetical protein
MIDGAFVVGDLGSFPCVALVTRQPAFSPQASTSFDAMTNI